MNSAIVFYLIGLIVKVEAALLLVPTAISVIYKDGVTAEFLLSAAIAYLVGWLLSRKKPTDSTMYAREGFTVVALVWIILSAIGALPFYISREIPSYLDCLFEVVSGFTTTGASILTEVESMSPGLLFWRSFTHWVGGMGVLVFAMAILPMADKRAMHLMRAEVPGPIVGKLAPKLHDTAKILYLIYIGLTVTQFILLMLGGMPAFDSAIHAFGTAGTGGFSCKNASIAAYDSAYIHWVITIFMALFGVNFNIYYYLLMKNFRSAFKNEELWWYFGIMAAASLAIAVNIMPMIGSFGSSLRYSAFQVSTIMTTTGFATADFHMWPTFSKGLLVLLMFIGASAGSTGGGLKVSRLLIIGKAAKNEIKRMLHPRVVTAVSMDGKPVGEGTASGAFMYLAIYVFIAAASVMVLTLDGYDLETTFTAMTACLNNIGPGLNLVGPTGNYSFFSPLSKIVLILDMLLGRLEIFPLILGLAIPMPRRGKAKNK